MDVVQIQKEQELCLRLRRSGKLRREIAEVTGLSDQAVYRRIIGAKKAERLDPEIVRRLAETGVVDLGSLHSGWLIQKNQEGSGSSLYFHLGPDDEKISFADAVRDALDEIPRLPKIKRPKIVSNGKANWVTIADLHVGGEYGSDELENDFNYAIDTLVSRLPAAEKAVIFELGDVLDANDHKGVTPHSGNPCDVKRDEHLTNTQTAIRLMRRAIYRLAETHAAVEVHMIPGNHDPSAYVAVMLSLEAHFENSPHIHIVVTDEPFRVISWGECAAFPHHGDTLKWPALKDVFADQFPDEWAAAKMHRHIMTAHVHHEKKAELVGCVAEHFRTLHKPNAWAKGKGLFNRGSLTGITVHKEWGEYNRSTVNIRPIYVSNPK
jgi:hypothetical protein